MKVLIVDDDPFMQKILESSLIEEGYEIALASDGYMALELIKGENPPEIVLLDWGIPVIDGIEVCRIVRSSSIPVQPYIIFVTGRFNGPDIIAGFEAGTDDYIVKPFSEEELIARIRVGKRVMELQSALRKKVDELQVALKNIKTLKGLIPICSHCKKIRNDKGYWDQLERYIKEHSEAQLTHGICPDCLKKYYLNAGDENKARSY